MAPAFEGGSAPRGTANYATLSTRVCRKLSARSRSTKALHKKCTKSKPFQTDMHVVEACDEIDLYEKKIDPKLMKIIS
jgi:hypothetical protein